MTTPTYRPYSEEEILEKLREYATDDEYIESILRHVARLTLCEVDDGSQPLEYLDYLTAPIDRLDMNVWIYDEDGKDVTVFDNYEYDITCRIEAHQEKTGKGLYITSEIREFFVWFAIEQGAQELLDEFNKGKDVEDDEDEE